MLDSTPRMVETASGQEPREPLTERRRLFLLILILAVVTITAVVTAGSVLYGAAFDSQQARLVETARNQARLIEAMDRFNAALSREDHPKGPLVTTIEQIIDAHEHYKGFGETGEFTLAYREGDQIVFLLSHRHHDLDSPQPVQFDSDLAEPMRQALLGNSGTLIGLDYRGQTVLAAFEPIEQLDLGIVAKIDLKEIRAPFIRAAIVCLPVILIVILLGAVLFLRITNPWLKKIMRSEQRFRSIVEDQTELLCRWLPDKRLSFVNEVYCRYVGQNREDLIGRSFMLFIPEEDRKVVAERLDSLTSEHPVASHEHRVIVPGGLVRWMRWTNRAILDHNGLITEVQAVGWDITERKQAEEELKASETRLRTVFEQAADAMFLIDPKGKFVAVNQRACDSLGYTRKELLAMSIRDINSVLSEKELSELYELLVAGAQQTLEAIHRRKNGTTFPVELRTGLIGLDGDPHVLAFVRDITERKKAEEAQRQSEEELSRYREHLEALVEQRTRELQESQEQVQRSARLASIGTLAAGMAHEINNPLGVILVMSQLARKKTNDWETAEATLIEVEKNVERCARIIKSVLQFSRNESTEQRSLNVNDSLRRSRDIVNEYAATRQVIVEAELSEDLPRVRGNSTELEQVLVNLARNAIEASNRGQVVKLRSEGNGEWVRLIIEDYGKGMDNESQERAFDPFYTTRQHEGGTGLGLSISHSIVATMGGSIRIERNMVRGTTMIVELPACGEKSEK